MYKIKKKNIYIYKIYNKINKCKKIFIICLSLGVDSNSTYKNLKKINKNIIKINVNHKTNRVEKKIFKNNKKNKILNIKIKNNTSKNEKNLKIKRFKKIKSICNKKKSYLWIFQQKDEILENYIIQKILKKNKINKKKEKKEIYKIKKIKPILKIKKNYIKKKTIKNNNKWIEEKDNTKFKNIRNKIRINITNSLKIYIKEIKKFFKI